MTNLCTCNDKATLVGSRCSHCWDVAAQNLLVEWEFEELEGGECDSWGHATECGILNDENEFTED